MALLRQKGLLAVVLSRYQLPLGGIHGIAHWGRVLSNARRIAPLTGADSRVVEVFAIVHDSQRNSEGHDPGHGPRAASFARSLRAQIDLDDRAFELLVEACDCHTRGASEQADITILTCLDADRLDIPRVGKRIRQELLFTSAARDPEILGWAVDRAIGNMVPALVKDEWGWEEGEKWTK